MKVDADWWKTMFDEVYLLTDARSVCDEDITRREVDIICELLPIRYGHRILDLCGGHGRHSLELCARGFTWCTLLDYSSYLIDYARTRAAECNHHMDFVRADARSTGLPPNSFDHVLIMGNSLGYIPEPAADRQIVAEANRVLRSGGWLLIDVADGAAVRDSFNPTAWHEIGTDIVVCRQRKMEGNTVYAREMVLSKQKGLIRDCTYCMRLYESQTVGALLEHAGFKRVNVHTNFSPHLRKEDYGFMNRRMLAAGQKP
ncbi:MAG: class I SAM-dependent methyltransferase [Deltaproteobacteria bacterium]|nr:MAG: class I SAM-dependent methyltransferase [Deltaproteobacteria bacterium]